MPSLTSVVSARCGSRAALPVKSNANKAAGALCSESVASLTATLRGTCASVLNPSRSNPATSAMWV
ncbi:MAG: hypothetical protein ACOY4B_09395 [Pseudomonadota bacterium]